MSVRENGYVPVSAVDLTNRIRSFVAERGRRVPAHGKSHWSHVLAESDVVRFRTVTTWLPPPPATLLNVGAGAGVLTDNAAALGYKAISVDTDDLAMAACRVRIR